MITSKTKGPPTSGIPHNKRGATPRTKAAAQKFAAGSSRTADEPLALVDRMGVVEIVNQTESDLRMQLAKGNLEQLEDVLEARFYAVRVRSKTPPWSYDEPNGLRIVAEAEGLNVSQGGRRGLVTWFDLAQHLADHFAADDEDISGAMHFGEDDPDPGTGGPLEYVEQTVGLDAIDLSPHNPRRLFDESELAALGENIKAVGLIQPIVLRQAGGRYELVAGERRLRAMRLAGLRETRARVAVWMTESEADEIRVVENFQRKELSAIEEARGFQRMIETHGFTQESLAGRLKCSQPHIANRLRLLKLPEKWQQRVISQEIPPTHARAILPWVEYPAIMEAIDKQFYDKKGKLHQDAEIGSVNEFEETVFWIIRKMSESLLGTTYSYELHRSIPCYKPTAEQRAELQVIEVDGEERALNTKLHKKLQAAHEKAYVADEGKAAKAKQKGADGKPRELTAAEKKAAAKKQAEQFARRLDEWRTNWLRWLVSRAIFDKPRVGLAAVVMNIGTYAGARIDEERIAELLHLDGKSTTRSKSHPWRHEATAGLKQAIAGAEPAELLLQFAADWLWDDSEEAPQNIFGREQLEALAVAAGIDLETEWSKNLAGPLSAAYFNLHNKEQLVAIADELSINELDECTPNRPKSDLVSVLMHSGCTKEIMPEEIKRLEGCVPGTKPAKKAAKPKPKKGKS